MKWRIKEKEVDGKKFYLPQYRRMLSPIWHEVNLLLLLNMDEEYCICHKSNEILIEKEDESILTVVLLYQIDTTPCLIGFYGYKTSHYVPALKTKEDAEELIKMLKSRYEGKHSI